MDETFARGAPDYPDVESESVLVDAMSAKFVLKPEDLSVVVASNLFGDILTDLAAVLQGGMGMAASASSAPGTDAPAMFEPVHGSAPDIAGRGVANPIGQIWSAALMLDFLGHRDAHDAILAAIETVLEPSNGGPRTGDLGGSASTSDVGRAIVDALASARTASR